jgi:phage gpG-like protein
MEISAKIDDREVIAMLERLQSRSDDMTPVMTRIGALYERRVLENFAKESAPDGTPWTPLSEVTMHMGLAKNKGWQPVRKGLSARGKRYLQGKKILFESGDLQQSIHFQADSDSVTIGSSGSIAYAAIQQLSGKAGRGRKTFIPAREYLAMNEGGNLVLADKDRGWILELIADELADVE